MPFHCRPVGIGPVAGRSASDIWASAEDEGEPKAEDEGEPKGV